MSAAGEGRAIERGSGPVTVSSLTKDLANLGIERGELMIVHVSLSKLGWVAGGEQAVVEALLGAVGPTGTIVMPAQSSQLTDPKGWENPPLPEAWIDSARDALPAFHPDLTPTRGMSSVVECLRTDRRSIRSPHPVVSFVALGPDAAEIVEHHPLSNGFSMASPLGRLYERAATIVTLGVDHATTTALHLAEDRGSWPGKASQTVGAPVLIDGERQWVEYEDLCYDDSDFAKLGEAFAATGAESTGPVGDGTGRRCDLVAMVDFAEGWLRDNRAVGDPQ